MEMGGKAALSLGSGRPMSQAIPSTDTGALRVSTATASPVQLAVFDFDNTMIDNQTGIIFTRYLLDKGLVSHMTVAKVIGWGAKYFVRLPVEQNRVREYIFSELTDLTPAELEVLAQEFHDTVIMEHYRTDALVELERLKRQGCVTLVASATFQEIVDDVAEHLQMDGAVGTRMAVDATGHFTGKVGSDVVQGEEKLEAIGAWADEHLGQGAWELAYAYGDHHSDIETLAASEHPTAVNPCFSLWRHAKRAHWPTVHWE